MPVSSEPSDGGSPPLSGGRTAGDQEVRLRQADTVWVVTRGAADVFIELSPTAERPGMRRHLLRVAEGGVLFGLAEDRVVGIGLVAIPVGQSELVAVAATRFRDVGAAQAGARVAGVDAWVRALASEATDAPGPTDALRLAPGKDLALADQEAARAADDVVWVEVVAGEVALFGTTALSRLTVAHLTRTAPFPLASGMWVVARGDGAHLECSATGERLLDGSIWPGLEDFNAAALERIAPRLAAVEEEEREHLAVAAVEDAAVVDVALRRLGDVLRRRAGVVGGTAAGDVPLVAAAATVAAAMGIELHFPATARSLLDEGDPLAALARIARLRIRRVELVERWWEMDAGPILGSLAEDDSPVALLPTGPASYVVVDPRDGSRRVVTREVAATIARDGHLFYRALPEHAVRAWELFRFGMRSSGFDLFLVLSAGVAGGLLGMLTPVVTGIIVGTVIPQAERSQLGQYSALMVVAAVATGIFGLAQAISLLRIRGKMDATVQTSVWDRLLALPMSFFRGYNAGDLAMRAMGINSIGRMVTGITLTTAFGGMFSLLSVALMLYYDWKLAVVGVFLVLVSAVVALLLYRAQLRYQRPLYNLQGRIAGQVLQIINGMAKLRCANAERRAFAGWAANFAEQNRLAVKAHSRANALSVFTGGFSTFATVVVFAAVAYFSKDIATGDFLAFNAAFGQFFGGVMGMLGALNSSMAVLPLYERARPILDAVPEVDPAKGEPGELQGAIDLDQVCFRYDPQGELVLNHVSLSVRPGEFVAVVGPTGAGKSTLFRLLLGFETPESGTISYDHRNLAGLDLRAVRRQLGVVTQSAKLMPGSIFDNIVGSAPLSEADAWEAARTAGLEATIRAMPMGMHTFVSEGAATFSGGQRQRLMIARAIVKRPRILLFDEATSALDNETQALVSEGIAKLNATRLVIAHRLSTVVHADRIVVLAGGRIVQSGTFAELSAKPGLFAELAHRQIA